MLDKASQRKHPRGEGRGSRDWHWSRRCVTNTGPRVFAFFMTKGAGGGGAGGGLGLRIASSVNQAAREGLALWLVGRTRSTPLGVPSFLEGVSDPTLVTGTALPGQGFSELIPTLEKQDWCWRDVVEHRTRGRGGRALFLKHSTRPVCPQYPLCAGGPPGCDGSLAGGHSIVLVSPCIPQST